MKKGNYRLLKVLGTDIPNTLRPFLKIARQLNTTEDKVISEIKALMASGIIRRFAAVLNHNRVGYKTNCLCAWKVPQRKISKVGKIIAGFDEVSHCYVRKAYCHWPYNLYAMIHARNRQELDKIILQISRSTGISQVERLDTLKELKKQAVRCFNEYSEFNAVI
ncbi:MAG: Lrp/AsnC family transcriptional regulator [Candidatus Omnitrophota bacterium]